MSVALVCGLVCTICMYYMYVKNSNLSIIHHNSLINNALW